MWGTEFQKPCHLDFNRLHAYNAALRRAAADAGFSLLDFFSLSLKPQPNNTFT
jgi:hypothetical protein